MKHRIFPILVLAGLASVVAAGCGSKDPSVAPDGSTSAPAGKAGSKMAPATATTEAPTAVKANPN